MKDSDTTEGDWENEGGVVLPDVDDNSPREELDAWTVKYHRKITRLTTEGEKDFDYSSIQYHGKTKNYKKQKPENET